MTKPVEPWNLWNHGTYDDSSLQDEFGNIDIYVFDQLLRGRIAPGMRVFDAGCGGGRNLVYLLRHGYDVCGNDADPECGRAGSRAGLVAVARRRFRFSRRADRARPRFPTITPTS